MTKLQILDLNDIMYEHKWNPFQITKIYYGCLGDDGKLLGGVFYHNGTRSFQILLGKLMGREFRFDGNVESGASIDQEYLRFEVPTFRARYEIWRDKK